MQTKHYLFLALIVLIPVALFIYFAIKQEQALENDGSTTKKVIEEVPQGQGERQTEE